MSPLSAANDCRSSSVLVYRLLVSPDTISASPAGTLAAIQEVSWAHSFSRAVSSPDDVPALVCRLMKSTYTPCASRTRMNENPFGVRQSPLSG